LSVGALVEAADPNVAWASRCPVGAAGTTPTARLVWLGSGSIRCEQLFHGAGTIAGRCPEPLDLVWAVVSADCCGDPPPMLPQSY
jgi:hypothetical protein